MQAPRTKKDYSFMYLNYLTKFLSTTAEVCEPLRHLTSARAEWMQYKTYQELYSKANTIIKKTYMWNSTMQIATIHGNTWI